MPKPQDADLRDVIGRKFDALGTHHPFEDLRHLLGAHRNVLSPLQEREANDLRESVQAGRHVI